MRLATSCRDSSRCPRRSVTPWLEALEARDCPSAATLFVDEAHLAGDLVTANLLAAAGPQKPAEISRDVNAIIADTRAVVHDIAAAVAVKAPAVQALGRDLTAYFTALSKGHLPAAQTNLTKVEGDLGAEQAATLFVPANPQ